MILEKLKSQKFKRLAFYCGMLFLPLLQFTIFYIVVNFNSMRLAFQTYEDGKYIFAGFKNFSDIFGMLSGKIESANALMLRNSFRNSAIAFVFSMLIQLPIAILISFYIYKKSSGLFKIFVFLPVIIPVTVNTLIFRQMTDNVLPWVVRTIDPSSTFQGLLYPENIKSFYTVVFYTIFYSFGASMLILSSSMSAISSEIVEAARLDGVTPIQELIHITLPQVFPIIITLIVIKFANFFNSQENLYSFYDSLASPELYTTGYYIYVKAAGARKINFPQIAALGLMLTAIIAPVTYFVRKMLNRINPVE